MSQTAFFGERAMTEPASAKIDEIIPEEYDLVVLGRGEGSKYVAWTLAKQGQRVAEPFRGNGDYSPA